MKFSYHKSYVLPQIVENRRTFCTVIDFLPLGFWKRVMLVQDSSHCYTINSQVVMVYLFAPGEPICSPYIILLLLFLKSIGRLPYQCFLSILPVFIFFHLLLFLCTCYLGYFMYFVVCVYFPCLVFIL